MNGAPPPGGSRPGAPLAGAPIPGALLPGVPLLGASLIVRDEARALPGCLAALAGLSDEIVVHDTGSVDDTVAIARGAGAVVLSGQWRDDFGWARNVALDAARADWILVVDADERVVGDLARVRALLAGGPPRQAFTVEVSNVAAAQDGLGYRHRSIRIFRRESARWHGRVHEQLATPDGDLLSAAALPPDLLRIEHHGYSDPAVVRAKAERNAVLLQARLAEVTDPHDPALAELLLDLGRTLVSAGHRQEAVDILEQVRALAPGTQCWAQASDFLARVLLGAGHDQVVLVLADQLAEAGADRRYCDWLRAQALAQLGDPGTALGLLRGIDQLRDPGGRDHDLGQVLEMRSLVAELTGRTEEALECLIAAMAGYGRVGGRGEHLVRLWGQRPAEQLAEQLAGQLAAAMRQDGPRVGAMLCRELGAAGELGVAVARLLDRAVCRP